jgi:hypothetical protein
LLIDDKHVVEESVQGESNAKHDGGRRGQSLIRSIRQR